MLCAFAISAHANASTLSQCNARAMASALVSKSRNGSKTGFLHSPEAASPRDNLFPRSRISRFAMVCSCNAQGSQWSVARNDKSRSRMIPQQVLSP
ncbi:hypothetical protein DdX_19686 [Ditylenchus destructor]|uniref:Uncharacterized protein n=1 Tax=Ditylenchus destructor TaxID=166010 RepID=A0AAD4QX69_9BILA|nr:hypothetical protein DdX_19686 [Ditylenchus destructor]